MGDVGSCLLGFSFGVLAFATVKENVLSLVIWVIVLAVFICDATLTLLMRFLKGEKWYAAHRSHAYQRLVQMGLSHAGLAIGFLLLNVVLLWPFAYFVWRSEGDSLYILSGVIVIMCLLWGGIQWRFHKLSIPG